MLSLSGSFLCLLISVVRRPSKAGCLSVPRCLPGLFPFYPYWFPCLFRHLSVVHIAVLIGLLLARYFLWCQIPRRVHVVLVIGLWGFDLGYSLLVSVCYETYDAIKPCPVAGLSHIKEGCVSSFHLFWASFKISFKLSMWSVAAFLCPLTCASDSSNPLMILLFMIRSYSFSMLLESVIPVHMSIFLLLLFLCRVDARVPLPLL